MLEHQTYFDEKTALFKEDSMNRIIKEVKKCRRCDGIKMSKRIHDIDEDFFESWNSKMAYVIGFAFADGNIYQRSLAWELNLEGQLPLPYGRGLFREEQRKS